MREILFRGKCVDSGEWVEGVAFPHDNRAVTMFRQHPMDGSLEGREVIPETVGQYTGLTDKNGTKIFEGDIVRVANMFIGKIAFAAGAFGVYTGYNLNNPIDYDYLASEIAPITGCNNRPHFCYEDYFVSLYEFYCNFNGEENFCPGIEVIGNIYDNPELLTE